MVGQPELRRMFLSPEFRQIRQRIFRSYHLPALSREAVEGYIRHRLSVVTDDVPEVFEGDAIAAICRFSQGLPRVVNTICDNALLSAYSADRRTVDGPFIDSVVAQMMVVGGQVEDPEAGAGLAALQVPHVSTAAPVATTGAGGMEWDRGSAQSYTQVMGGLVQGIDEIARRVQDLSASLQTQQAPSGDKGGPQACADADDSTARILGELQKSDGELRSALDAVTGRITAIEQRFENTAGDWAGARAVQATLKPLVEEARLLVGRAEGANCELRQRDTQLRELATTIEDIVRDLRRLLDVARETSTEIRHAEHSAGAACDRLVAQSQRSRQLADELSRIVIRMVPQDGGDRTGGRTIGQSQRSPEAGRDTVGRAPVRRAHQGDAHDMLERARESSAGLRHLPRRAGSERGESRDPAERPASALLAQQVESLLEMIEPDTEGVTPEAARARP
jgi:hypothetical protein